MWTHTPSNRINTPNYKRIPAIITVLMCIFSLTSSLTTQAYPTQDAEKVIGSNDCVGCHEHSPHVADLDQTPHAILKLGAANKRMMQHENVSKIATAMGVNPSKPIAEFPCANCHATFKVDNGKPKPIEGVSCESCHGAADEWVDAHPRLLKKQKFSELKAKGMIHSKDVYGFTENCLGCHMIPDEKLVSAGHFPGKSFVLTARQSKIQHGDAPANNIKAKMMILGYSIELEKAAHAISQTTQNKGTLREQLKSRIRVAAGNLVAIGKLTQEPLVQKIVTASSGAAALVQDDGGAFDAQGFKNLSETLKPLSMALSDAPQPNIVTDAVLNYQHNPNPSLTANVQPVNHNTTVIKDTAGATQNHSSQIQTAQEQTQTETVSESDAPVSEPPPKTFTFTPLPEGAQAVSRFELILPRSQTLCSTSSPWLLGEVAQPESITLKSGNCHGLKLELAHPTHLFLFHATQTGKMTEILSDRCDLLNLGTPTPSVGKTHFLPKDQYGREGVLILNDEKGEEWLYLLAVNSQAGIDKIRETLGTPPSSCLKNYNAPSGGYDALEALMNTLGTHPDIQITRRAIIHE